MLYGLGTTIGAGVFVLTGHVAGAAGTHAPFAFVLAACVAGLTAVAFARLSRRFPEAAGEAAYVREGFGAPRLGMIVGFAVAGAGLISSATIAHGFAGYLARIVDLPAPVLLAVFAAAIGGIASWGVAQSVGLAAAVTFLEVGVLLVVCVAGAPAVAEKPETLLGALPPADLAGWSGAFAGGLLAFYAFLGFEDIVNMAEECKRPERDLPVAIYGTLAATTLLYLGVSLVSLAAMPLAELAASDAPVADAFVHATGYGARPVEIIAVVSVTNGALIQAIMAARVLYGLARKGQAPRWLGYVSARTQTPVVGVWCATALILALALAFPLEALARTTSLVILTVFVFVNLAAARLDRGWPRRIALLAALACAAMLAVELARRIG